MQSRINMRAWARQLCAGERRALPVLTYPGLELTGLSIMQVITDATKQAEVITTLAARFPAAAAVTIMDLSVEAEAFGAEVRFSDEDVPTVIGRRVSGLEEIEAMPVPAVGAARTQVYLDTARLVAAQVTDRPALGGHIGPLSLAARLFDMNHLMMALALEREVAHALLEKCTQFLIEYSRAFKAAGAHGVIIAEPAAGLLSAHHCAEFSTPYVKRIIDAVQDDHFMVVLHNCGKTVKLVPTLLATGAAALHFGNAVDMTEILPQIPADRLAMGNIDPAGVFRHGSVEDITEKTGALLDAMAEYPNFILSSGCDVPPGTPLANVETFYDTLAEWNCQPEARVGSV